MGRSKFFKCLILTIAISCCIIKTDNLNAVEIAHGSADRTSGFSKNILWAWDRPEYLNFIDPDKVGIAFLAETIVLKGSKVIIKHRVQPLNIPDKTQLIAVVHIESSLSAQPQLSEKKLTQIISAIASLGRIKHISAVQIDFDAKKSERSFYRYILQDLRLRLPDNVALSITALASWCMQDNWLNELPIDEAVPMLFRMGPDHSKVISYLKAGNDFSSSFCRQSIGISTDEPLALKQMAQRRLYIFHPRSWTEADTNNILTEVRQKQ